MFVWLLAAFSFSCILCLAFAWAGNYRRPTKSIVFDNGGVNVRIDRGWGRNRWFYGATTTVDLPGRLEFKLRAENWFDRLSKALGLAREWQTRDRPFDDSVYIDCDDPELQSVLCTDPVLRTTLGNLLMTQGRAVNCSRGRLWIECGREGQSGFLTDDELKPAFAKIFAADLQILRERLLPHANSSYDNARDRTTVPRRWFNGFASTLGLLGIFGGIYQICLLDKQVVHGAIAAISSLIAIGVGLAILIAFFLLLGGTSSAHRVFLRIVFAAVPGLWLTSGAVLDWYNEYFDSSSPARHSVRVLGKYTTQTKNGLRYHLELAGWPDTRANRHVIVNHGVYGIVKDGGCVDVVWRHGKLGDGWVSGYEPNSTNSCEGTFTE